MNTSRKATITPVHAMLAALLTLAGVLGALAPAASAEGLDEIVVVAQLPVFEDLDYVVALPALNATVSVDCTNEDPIHLEVGNPTDFATNIVVSIDDEDVSGLQPVNQHQAFQDHYFAAENSVAHVVVTAGATELADDLLKVNCIAADPWFEFIQNCDAGLAWVELGNDGPDSAVMGVHYTNLPHAGGEIAPGDSTIQPLAVQPNEFADFSIEVDGEAIYSDGYLFDCPVPVEPEPVEDETTGDVDPDVKAPTEPDLSEKDTKDDETVAKSEVIEGAEGDVELAAAAGLVTGEQSNTATLVLVGLLLTLGIAMTVGSIAALRSRR